MRTTIQYCNTQDPDNFVTDPKQAAKSKELTDAIKKLRPEKPKFDMSRIRTALFRPFFKQNLYFDPVFVTAKYRIPSFFPSEDSENLAIIVPDKIKGSFSAFITNMTPDLEVVHHGQCFPLYSYDKSGGWHDNITEHAVWAFRIITKTTR